jgi:hypothetical protein
MTTDEFKAELPNVVALLTALGAVLPGRVDVAVTEFLDRASQGGIECELLHSALALQTQLQTVPAAARKLKFG